MSRENKYIKDTLFFLAKELYMETRTYTNMQPQKCTTTYTHKRGVIYPYKFKIKSLTQVCHKLYSDQKVIILSLKFSFTAQVNFTSYLLFLSINTKNKIKIKSMLTIFNLRDTNAVEIRNGMMQTMF